MTAAAVQEFSIDQQVALHGALAALPTAGVGVGAMPLRNVDDLVAAIETASKATRRRLDVAEQDRAKVVAYEAFVAAGRRVLDIFDGEPVTGPFG